MLGCFEKRRIIQCRQCLQRCVRSGSPRSARLTAGSIEREKRGIGGSAAPKRINAATITVFSLTRRPLLLAVMLSPDAFRLGREDTRPANFLRKQTTRFQSHVADSLSFQAEARSSCQQPVVRITLIQFGGYPGRLPVSRRRHNEALHRLYIPPLCD